MNDTTPNAPRLPKSVETALRDIERAIEFELQPFLIDGGATLDAQRHLSDADCEALSMLLGTLGHAHKLIAYLLAEPKTEATQ